MKHILMAFALVLLGAAATRADNVHPKVLTLHAPAPAQRALQYALLPELRDTIPGNAVKHYRQAIQILKKDGPPETGRRELLDEWMRVPLKDLPREEVGKFLNQCRTTFQEVEAGTYSEQCDWGLTQELRTKGISASFDELQAMRVVGTLLSLRCRHELADGRLDKAVRTLRTGFAVARHIADAPLLIPSLVATGVLALMIDRLEEFIQQPDAPNLYWPLTDLPRPFIDLRKGMQGERATAYGNFPGMAEMTADLHAKPWTPEQAKKFISEYGLFHDVDDPLLKWAADVKLAKRLTARHELAKNILINQGRSKELVDAMPHLQVAMLDAFLQYEQMVDEVMKWQSLPFWEALPGMTKAAELQKKILNEEDGPAIPLARLLLPTVKNVVAARTRIDRRIAALCCIEAVRLYATEHDGKLLTSLDEIKDAPIPLDPVTGKLFDYHIAGDRAFLSCTPFPDQPADNANTPSFELIMKK